MCLAPTRHSRRRNTNAGFTLIELLIGAAIFTLLMALAVPSYQQYVERACINESLGELQEIDLALQRYYSEHFEFPATLAEAGLDERLDCWDQPYRYLKLQGLSGLGANRKDRSENPLNTDFDLYSVGADGQTQKSLRPKVSHDDLIRARNGAYFGLAEDY